MPSAFLAAYAVAAALFRRAQTGRGQYIDLAMIDAAILMQLSVFSRVFTDGSGGGLIGNRSTAAVLTADAFPCSDGYIAVSAVTRPQGRIVLELAGVDPDLWDDFDPENPTAPRSQEVVDIVYAAFRRRPMKDWEARLREAGQSASCVLDAKAVVALDQMAHRPVFRDDPAEDPAAPRTIGGAFVANEDGPGHKRRGIRDRRGHRSGAGRFRIFGNRRWRRSANRAPSGSPARRHLPDRGRDGQPARANSFRDPIDENARRRRVSSCFGAASRK